MIKIRICIIFMHLRSKLISEMCQKKRGLDRKTEKPSQSAHFAIFFFFQKITVFIEKRNTLTGFLL